MPRIVPNITQRGKRVVKVSIIFSYWLIPLEELLGKSPDTFVAALQDIFEFRSEVIPINED